MRRGLLLAAMALTLGACAVTGLRHKPPTAAARGHEIAQHRCAVCHAVEAVGGASPRPLAPPFASRGMRATAGLEGRLADLTSKGHYEMPPLGLRPDEVSDLRAYIESLNAH
jgi:mono/diheme cytochrome c family protein